MNDLMDNMDDTVNYENNNNYYRSSSSLNRSAHGLMNANSINATGNQDDGADLNGSVSSRGRARKPTSQQLPSQNREKLAKLRRNLLINSDMMNLGNISSNYEDYFDSANTPRSSYAGSTSTLAAAAEPKYSSRVHSSMSNHSATNRHLNQYDNFANLNRHSQSVTAPVERSSSRLVNQQNTAITSTTLTATTTTLTTTITNPALALTLSPLNSYRSINSVNNNTNNGTGSGNANRLVSKLMPVNAFAFVLAHVC